MDLKNSAQAREKNRRDLDDEDTQERPALRKSSSTSILEDTSPDTHEPNQGDHPVQTVLDAMKRARETRHEPASAKTPPFRRRQALQRDRTQADIEAAEIEM